MYHNVKNYCFLLFDDNICLQALHEDNNLSIKDNITPLFDHIYQADGRFC